MNELLLKSSESDKTMQLNNYAPGTYITIVEIPAFMFNVGNYNFNTVFHKPCIKALSYKQNLSFEIIDVDNPKSVIFKGASEGKVATILNYFTINKQNYENR